MPSSMRAVRLAGRMLGHGRLLRGRPHPSLSGVSRRSADGERQATAPTRAAATQASTCSRCPPPPLRRPSRPCGATSSSGATPPSSAARTPRSTSCPPKPRPSPVDLRPLASRTDLDGLSLNDTPVADLTPLAGLDLTTLSLRHTLVASLAPIAGMLALRSLERTGTPVSDLAPLTRFPSLNSVGLSSRAATPRCDGSVGMCAFATDLRCPLGVHRPNGLEGTGKRSEESFDRRTTRW